MNWIDHIDWRKLQEQKAWLLEQYNPTADELVNLLDHLQDYAVDEYGLPETIVFGFTPIEKE